MRWGFCKEGLVAFVLALVPTLVWVAIAPADDVLRGGRAVPAALALLMQMAQVGMAAALVALKSQAGRRSKAWLLLAVVFLLAYYGLWTGHALAALPLWGVIGLAVAPSVYFVCVAGWLKNQIALLCAAVFGICHIMLAFIRFWGV